MSKQFVQSQLKAELKQLSVLRRRRVRVAGTSDRLAAHLTNMIQQRLNRLEASWVAA